jgi:hypothetical protein
MKFQSILFLCIITNSIAGELPSCPRGFFTSWNLCEGEARYPNGDTYSGEWKNGRRHGFGTLTKPNGFKYVGGFFEDSRHGKGEEVLRPAYKFTGIFQKDKKSGYGRLEINGEYFEGSFKDDKLNGLGFSGRLGGDKTFDGTFLNGVKSGQGTLFFDDGRKYIGQFNEDLMNGTGTILWPDGDSYTGNFINDQQTGQGILISKSTGEKYVGSFLNGLFHGKGERFNRAGTLLESGIWTNGVGTKVISHINKDKSPTNTTIALTSPELPHINNNQKATITNAQKPINRTDFNQVDPPIFVSRKALVIGNDRYTNINILANAVADAESISNSLKNYGFDVDLHIDLNEKSFRQALRDFKYKVQGGDEVLFFFAGHGVEISGANYLIPTDIFLPNSSEEKDKDKLKDEAIDLKRFMEELEERKTKFTLAVIDACREDPFPKRTNSRNTAKKHGLAPTTPATGQMIIFSAGTGQLAIDTLGDNDKIKNGLFTRVLLTEINKPGTPIDRVLKNVRTEVNRIAKTIGKTQVPAIYDQSEGDFYIRLR